MITKSNILELQQLIESVTSMIQWVSTNTKSSKRVEMMNQLVDSRRRLKRIYNAMSDNPTIAAYGESQQGKSYIISSLLSSPGHPLMITDDDGKKIDFIDNINMKSEKQESTGVVTRFTTTQFVIDPHFPVKLHLLSIADFITILADSYMNDINGYQPYSETDLKGIAQRLIDKYTDHAESQGILTEDEVADVREYIETHDTKMGAVYINSGYFDVLSQLIRRVPQHEWVNVFSPLWKEDEVLSRFFTLFVDAYSTMNFAADVFVSIKAVLNDFNDGSPTLMCVRALDGLQDLLSQNIQNSVRIAVMLPDKKKIMVNKSLLGAMTAEAVYNVDSDVLNAEVEFCFDGIREGDGTSIEDNVRMLRNNGIGESFKKNFLQDVDLLDFPGARGRDLGYQPQEILKKIVELLLRCKVSYLFNKYSEDLKLSILMFCHSQGNTTPNLVAPLLNFWVNTYIGKTPQEREKCLLNYGISPLFMVSTMYNLDLIIKKGAIDTQIWQRRLGQIFYKEVINPINTWFDDWLPGKSFDNTFLLRDYFYSSDANEGNNLFTGYPGPETGEVQQKERAQLKHIFLKDTAVKQFFDNPELAWDVASTIGNDGSYYMLKRLAQVSVKAAAARERQFNDDMKQVVQNVLGVLSEEFHDDNDSELLEGSIKAARRFDFMLRRTCESNSDFFGRMVQFLQINSNFVANFFSKLIHSNGLLPVIDVKPYEMLVRGVEEYGLHFDPASTEAAYKKNFEILEMVFGITGPDDPLLKGIDPQTLFQATYKKRCTPSTVLATSLIEQWQQNLLKPESSVFFTKVGFDGLIFSKFITNFTNMMDKVCLADHVARAIQEYVDFAPVIAPHNEELIADIATNIYNNFVMDLGLNLLNDEQRTKVNSICEKYHLPKAVSEENEMPPLLSDEEQLGLLFEQLENLCEGEGGQLTQLPAYIRMRRWMTFVFMSYTVAYDVADYDEVANAQLGEMLCIFREKHQMLG